LAGYDLIYKINKYDKSALTDKAKISDGILFDNAKWRVTTKENFVSANETDYEVSFVPDKDVSNININAFLKFENWSRDNYVLFPAGAYNGNRFEALDLSYPPILPPEYRGQNIEYITDVPRLEMGVENSCIQFVSGDLSVPAASVFLPHEQKAVFILTSQKTAHGENGLEMFEGDTAYIGAAFPCVKREFQYVPMKRKGRESEYCGACIKKGEGITINFKIFEYNARCVQDLFDRFTEIRKSFAGVIKFKNELPFSKCFEIYEKTLNQMQYNPFGYYRVGVKDNPRPNRISYQDWQTGWVGGGINSFAALCEGTEVSKQRAMQTLDFMSEHMQGKSGLFYGCAVDGRAYGDNFYDHDDKNFHLARKSADALYFILKHLQLCRRIKVDIKVGWENSAKQCSDAFCKLWRDNGQFGQFVGADSGDIIIGGSSSAVMAVGGLALAGEYFNNDMYLQAAQSAADYYYNNFIKMGYTNGGPGEILQCPDSESCFAFVESFVALYEVTGKQKYIKMAKDAANQFFSWVVSYNYEFPPNSEFGKKDMQTVGSVYANVQNKHSAPGICTFSGDSLLKLYRATGDEKYLELIREISHNITQYMSRIDRPIKTWDGMSLPEGFMNERVNMGDWESKNGIGGVFYGQCWCSVSAALTYAEIPGIYVRKDLNKFWVFDHVEAKAENLKLYIYNPCDFDAKVKILIEESTNKAWGQAFGSEWEVVKIRPKERAIIDLN